LIIFASCRFFAKINDSEIVCICPVAFVQTEDKLSSLVTTVEQLQGSTNNHDEEKKRLKQDWKVKMTQLNQVNFYLLHYFTRAAFLCNKISM